MKFKISGADKDTGENIEMTIEAADQTAAQEFANRKGIMVSRVTTLAVHIPPAPAPIYPAQFQQPLEQGHFRGAPVINVATPRRGNSLGVVSLILGIIAFLICWIPYLGLIGVPLAALGLLLGLIGLLIALTRNGASIGYPIAGSAICSLALFISIGMTTALMGSLKAAGEKIVAENERRNATNQIGTNTNEQETPANQPETNLGVPPNEWASAETPIKQGDVQVQVKAVKVGQIETQSTIGNGTGISKDALVSIELEITNLSENKKLSYRTWGGESYSFGKGTKLTDNFNNGYKIVNFGFATKIAGSVESESVYPGKAIKDVIAFEEPVGKVEYLNLELPAEQFGGSGMLRIRIHASMIQR